MATYIIVLPKGQEMGELRSDVIRALKEEKIEFESGPEGVEQTYCIWRLGMNDAPTVPIEPPDAETHPIPTPPAELAVPQEPYLPEPVDTGESQ